MKRKPKEEQKERWFRIYVDCRSTERFGVMATSKSEALRLYHDGEAELEKDEVEDRQTIRVEEVPS